VYNANTEIRKEAAEALNQRLKDSQQSTANMVSAALSGIFERDNDEDGC